MASTHHPGDPVLREAQMHLVLPGAPVTCRIASSENCLNGKSASFVRHVCIDVSGTPLEGHFLAGQSFGVIPPGNDAAGRPNKVRLYSIACPSWGEDGAGKVVSTTPKRLLDETRPHHPADDPARHSLFVGVCSNYLCDLTPGDPVHVSGPAGKRFVLPQDPDQHDYLFLATGTGIAPFRGMLMELLEGPPSGKAWQGPCRSRIHLVMGAAYMSDLLYDRQLRELAEAHPNFSYHTAISRELAHQSRCGPYVHNYLESELDQFGPFLSSPRTLIYMCGLAGMQVGVYRLLCQHSLAGQYLTVHEAISAKPPVEWTTEEIKRRVHATHRCTIEVY